MGLRGTAAKGLLIALALSLIPVAAVSAQKITPGSTCKVYKQKVVYKNKTYTCIKSGKKLIWSKGVAVKKPKPTPTSTPAIKAEDLKPGLIRADYLGYYDDDLSWFKFRSPRKTSVVTEVNLQTNEDDNFSIQWTGYFIPTESGSWTITSTSDDGSGVWIGESAINQVPQSPALLSAPGIHGPYTIYIRKYFEKGNLYPIRILFGDKTNWAQMTLSLTPPSSGSPVSKLQGLVWYSPVSTEKYSGIDAQFANSRISKDSQSSSESATSPARFRIQVNCGTGLTACPETTNKYLQSPELCKIRDNSSQRNRSMSFGFPRPNFVQRQKTSPQVLVVPLSFSDLKFSNAERELSKELEDTRRFYAINSWGRVNLNFSVLPKDFSIDIDATFEEYKNSFNSDLEKVRQSLLLKVQTSEIANFDAIVITTPRSNQISWGGGNGGGDKTSTKYGDIGNYYLYVGGNRPNFDLPHILGHDLYALTDLYMSGQSILENFKAPNDLLVYDLMASGSSKYFSGWVRWLNGWLKDSEVTCLNSELKDEIVYLNFLENSEGSKLISIPLNESKILNLEYRYANDFGYCCEVFVDNGKGLLIYSFDGNIRQGFGQARSYQSPKLLVNGETAIFEGYRTEVLGVDKFGMYLKISKI